MSKSVICKSLSHVLSSTKSKLEYDYNEFTTGYGWAIFPRRIFGSLILSKSGYTDLMSLFILELCLLPLLHL